MINKKILKNFPKHIIARGKNYYINGNVSNLKNNNGTYTAIVSGTYDYKVLIKTSNEDIVDMDCDCPYCFDNGYCKHIVAAILEINESESLNNISCEEFECDDDLDEIYDDVNSSYDIYEDLLKMSKEELISLILNEFDNNSEFRHRYYLKNKKISKSELIHQYENIRCCYEDFDGFIDYYSANEFGNEMSSFISELRYSTTNKENAYEVLKLMFYIFHDLDSIEIDDSSGNLSVIMLLEVETILEIIKIHHEYELEVIKFVLKYIKNQKFGIAINNLIMLLNDLEYEDKEAVSYLKDELERMITEEFDENDEGYYNYVLQELIKLLPNLYKILQLDKEKIDVFLKQYIFIPEIADYYLEVELRKNNYNEAIEIVKQIIRQNDRIEEIKHKYMNKLICIYEEIGDHNNLIDDLKTMILEFDDLEMYKKLKSILSKEEFKLFFEELEIVKERNFSFINKIYYEEKQKEKLINSILKEKDLYGNQAIKYEFYLIDEYNDILLNLHKTNIIARLEKVSSRNEYRRLAIEVEQLKRFKDSHLCIKDILIIIQEKYKKKTALQDEMFRLYMKYLNGQMV